MTVLKFNIETNNSFISIYMSSFTYRYFIDYEIE